MALKTKSTCYDMTVSINSCLWVSMQYAKHAVKRYKYFFDRQHLICNCCSHCNLQLTHSATLAQDTPDPVCTGLHSLRQEMLETACVQCVGRTVLGSASMSFSILLESVLERKGSPQISTSIAWNGSVPTCAAENSNIWLIAPERCVAVLYACSFKNHCLAIPNILGSTYKHSCFHVLFSGTRHYRESCEGPFDHLPTLISPFSHGNQDKEADYCAEKYSINVWLPALGVGRGYGERNHPSYFSTKWNVEGKHSSSIPWLGRQHGLSPPLLSSWVWDKSWRAVVLWVSWQGNPKVMQ